MALSDILKSIKSDAEAKADEIKGEYAKKYEALVSEWDIKTGNRRKELLEKKRRELISKTQSALFNFKLKGSAKILDKKVKVLNDVFNKAENLLSEMSEEKQVGLLAEALKKLPKTEGILFGAGNNKNILEKALGKSGRNDKISNEILGVSGGFVYRTDRIEVDMTYKALVVSASEKMKEEIAENIFKNN
ncbi:MAG: hypothetical protein COV29_02445 [Candidatus Yanofskybacteria bacterium CG10_big_fil_rev_8_21_14_0_10_36_16]|uniref:V-type ATP synthase subunit E n=1 Tax=Candidatus Yanofskybacteria bacterium CG10_big_fil_rev_8_21_14_0_10_36_16 TaxID=1975096 RepID=A0A2J0QBE5_9BACT|nr:MAG: hypothetical protein COV29_02445 [Candidatus Yanofskybacteria bacterium CG10_big_fil_rev_8_21_14_0_10_36_16]